MPAADVDALNYPYIRIRSVDWLKRTLLLFPHVVRMTPFRDVPADDPAISEFERHEGQRGPLLRSARLHDRHVERAQRDLIHQLQGHFSGGGKGLLTRFRNRNLARDDEGQAARNPTVWERRLSENGSFQISRYKMFDELTEYLLGQQLAWEPEGNISDGPGYLEMNPRLGEAIMATLAVACAENEGLQVVTEFPRLHGSLIGVPRDKILAAALEEKTQLGRTSGSQIAEFLVYRRCNVDDLSLDGLVALKKEGDALAKFRERLESLATTLPPIIESGAILEQRLNDVLSDMFKEWHSEQANLSNYARKLFGGDAIKEPGKLIQKLIESAVNRDHLRAAQAGGSTAIVGGLTLGVAQGAIAGFVVAVVFHAVSAIADTFRTGRQSPTRYLSLLQENGVAFSLAK